MAAIERYPVVLKFDGLAAGKGVVIAADEAQARAALEAFLVERALRRRARRGRGAPRGRGALAAGAVRRRARRADGARRRTTSASSTATRARTPAAWAPTRRCPASTARASRRSCAPIHQPVVDELRHRGTPFHGVPLRRADAHRRRAARARVQRALRRPRDAGRAAAAALGPARPAAALDACPAAWRATTPEWDERWAVTRRARLAAATRSRRRRATSSAASTRCPRDVEVTHAGTGAAPGGDDRHRRRPRAQRHRAGRRPRLPPATPPMLPPT